MAVHVIMKMTLRDGGEADTFAGQAKLRFFDQLGL